MTIDRDALERLAGYTDAATGISERFVRLSLRSGTTVGVLTHPAGEPSDPAWLLCHSFSREQAILAPTEARIARRLARAGHAVLRFHAQGYGDSQHPDLQATVWTQADDALDAAGSLASMVGAGIIGTIGIRLGAAVAALAADRLRASDLVAVAPAVNGTRAMDALIRQVAMRQIVTSSRTGVGSATVEDVRALVHRRGYLDLDGYLVGLDSLEENCRLDLVTAIGAFHGRALLVQVSVSERPDADIGRFAQRLEALGSHVDRRIVVHPRAAVFGVHHVQMTGPDVSEDTMVDLPFAVAETVGSWAEEVDPTPRGDR